MLLVGALVGTTPVLLWQAAVRTRVFLKPGNGTHYFGTSNRVSATNHSFRMAFTSGAPPVVFYMDEGDNLWVVADGANRRLGVSISNA